MTTGFHLERAATFASYHSFAWGPPDALPTGDPRLDANTVFRDRVLGAVERQLMRRGLAHADQPVDLLIHYHANVRQRIDVNAADRGYGYTTGSNVPDVVEYEQGTLVVDIVDARTNALVWRGWAQDAVDVNNQDNLQRQVEQGVARMFEGFPRIATEGSAR